MLPLAKLSRNLQALHVLTNIGLLQTRLYKQSHHVQDAT
jgi:hypothetical protein